MSRTVTLSISQVVGGGICVSLEDGNRLHDRIVRSIEAGDRVALSFFGVTRMTTAFLNAAVGQLYNEYDEATVRERLAPPVEASQDQLGLLKRVVDNAKLFFANQERARQAISDAADEK